LISTSASETWAVGLEGCPEQYGPTCADKRGDMFQPNASTSWNTIGNYSLILEGDLGYSVNASFGHDIVALGYPGTNAISLQQQIVAAIASPDFWLGVFGLDPAPTNFTTMNDPQPSFLTSLMSR
jgi:hypothetical protein